MQGFGGVLAITQRVLCEQRRWLTQAEFVEILSMGQILPGPNVCNLSLIIGDRFFGWRGAFAALAGMMFFPLVTVLIVTAAFGHVAQYPAVAGALHGMGAVAAGLIGGTALKLAVQLRSNPLGLIGCTVLGLSVFGLVVWARVPLLAVLLTMGPLACAWAWWLLGRQAMAQSQGPSA
jgi:chromate transporter